MSLSEFTVGARALPPAERAALASTARLLSCLVTESCVRALFFPLVGFEAAGFGIVLKPETPLTRPYTATDVLAVLPLRHTPIFKYDGQDVRAKEIGLLDPYDMMPLILEINFSQTEIDMLKLNPVCSIIFDPEPPLYRNIFSVLNLLLRSLTLSKLQVGTCKMI